MTETAWPDGAAPNSISPHEGVRIYWCSSPLVSMRYNPWLHDTTPFSRIYVLGLAKTLAPRLSLTYQLLCSLTQSLININVCLCECDGNGDMPLKQIRQGPCLQSSYSLEKTKYKQLPKIFLLKKSIPISIYRLALFYWTPSGGTVNQVLQYGHHLPL